MKKILLFTVCSILIFSMFACSDNKIVQDDTADSAESIEVSNTPESKEITETEDENVITMYSTLDLAAIHVEDVYKLSDVVVKARYLKDLETYPVQMTGEPVTVSRFEVSEVVKGEFDAETVNAHHYGGRITMYDQMQVLKDNTVTKRGYEDVSEEEAKKIYIESATNCPRTEFNTVDEYLLMMSYDPDREIYFIICEGYGSPVIKDGKVYNAAKEEFVDIEKIKEPAENKKIITITSSGDLVASDVKDVLELADLSLRVRYEKELDVFALKNTGAAVAKTQFKVLEVVKGKYSGENITVQRYGGLLPLNEYLEAIGAQSAEKAGYNFTEEEAENVYVEISNGTPKVEFNQDDEYLLMLSYDPETEVYFVLCGGYGSPVIKDGKVYNAVNDEYVDLLEAD